MTKLIDFYTNKSPSGDGLYLKDMWGFNDWQLEHTHHFIQWMFPLEKKSQHCDDAPCVTDDDLRDAENSEEFKANLLKSLYKIEDFWGFRVVHDGCKVRDEYFRDFLLQNWITAYNHNFIRIPRVIHSLIIFGFDKEANELMEYLENEVYPNYQHLIGAETLAYWRSALDINVFADAA